MAAQPGRLIGVLALICAWPLAAAAQKPPLAEVARKEQERRKAIEASQRVLTNKDLPPSAIRPLPAGPPAELALPEQKAETRAKPEEDEPDEQKDETWWRGRMTEARERLHRNEVLLEALQSRVNALSTDFVSRDDPFQRARIGEDRQKALLEMQRVSAETELLKNEIDSIQEEARRLGVPPGWLR